MPGIRICLAEGCEDAAADAPLDLCEGHLALAAEWAWREFGTVDLLPAPCGLCASRVGVQYPSGWICAVCEWRFGDVVDDELPPPRVEVVYYLRFADRVKVGTTANPRQRLAVIRHHELLAFERGGRRLEQRRHEEFANDRLGTSEWFRMSDAIRRHVDAVRAGAADPWEAYARWVSEALALRG